MALQTSHDVSHYSAAIAIITHESCSSSSSSLQIGLNRSSEIADWLFSPAYYLRRRLFVSVCCQDCARTNRSIFYKLVGRVKRRPRKFPLIYRADPLNIAEEQTFLSCPLTEDFAPSPVCRLALSRFGCKRHEVESRTEIVET